MNTTSQIRAAYPLRMSHSHANVIHELCDRVEKAEASADGLATLASHLQAELDQQRRRAAEAEHTLGQIRVVIENYVVDLQALLDRVDARDSLAYREAMDRVGVGCRGQASR